MKNGDLDRPLAAVRLRPRADADESADFDVGNRRLLHAEHLRVASQRDLHLPELGGIHRQYLPVEAFDRTGDAHGLRLLRRRSGCGKDQARRPEFLQPPHHIAGVTPRPIYMTFPNTEPSGCLSQPKMMSWPPALSSSLLLGAAAGRPP